MKKSVLTAAFLACTSLAWGGQFNLGEQFQAWNSDYVLPFNGWELWTPISLNFNLDPDLSVFARGRFGTASYTDPTGTIPLTAFSDTILGTSLRFNSFSVPSVLNINLNLPTGDTSWESKQFTANIPTEFVYSRYQGRGFGVNAMYGLSFPTGKGGEMGMAAGYQYTGEFNPAGGSDPATSDLKLGDTLYLALNILQSYGKTEMGIFRLAGSYYLSTQEAGADSFRMGPSFTASYSWKNPKAFSLEAWAQMFLPAQRLSGGVLTTEPHNSYGPRLFLGPSLAMGDFNLAGRIKYILANGYPTTDALYAGGGGGWLFGFEPSLFTPFDKESGLRFTISYDLIIVKDADLTTVPYANATYNRFTFGTNYEVKW